MNHRRTEANASTGVPDTTERCPPSFVYFDLGRVLLHFDHAIACRQLSEVSGASAQRVREVVFDNGLESQYERGELTTDAFVAAFRDATGTTASRDALVRAAAEIFAPHDEVIAMVEAMGPRTPLGVLSNTCEAHWEHVVRTYSFLESRFQCHALSYRIGCLKPQADIYEAAATLAGTEPSRLLFIDDLADNAQGALDAGWDAIHFTSPPQLRRELTRRGLLPDE